MTMKGKKKKGRPSIIDLQKRALLQQQNQTQVSNSKFNIPQNPNKFQNQIQPTPSSPSFSTRRSTRYNSFPATSPSPEPEHSFHAENGDADDDDDDDERREKKVRNINIPPHTHPKSSANSSFRNSDSLLIDVAYIETFLNKSYVINEVQKLSTATEYGRNGTAVALVSGPTSTPLPDKRLLISILDKLQKKDTRGVFAEPVDPEELPDYHEVIANPMDFSTVRKKLDGGLYANLEQLEADIFLICSNAMEYNASHTIYFRQARSIQELVKKDFDSLRQGGDSCEPRRKRGRPPKKPIESPSTEHVVPKCSPDATPATGVDDAMRSNSYNLRKGTSLYKFRPRYDDSYLELPGLGASSSKATTIKYGKKEIILDENRRNTYNHCSQFSSGNDDSVFSGFGGDRKQLIVVGLYSDHSYARSLARFAADLGPLVWKIASNKIQSALPPGVEFGPGWIGETNVSSSLEDSPVSERLVVSSEKSPYVYSKSYHQSPLGINSVPQKSAIVNGQDLMELRQQYPQSDLALLKGTMDGMGQRFMNHSGLNGFNADRYGFEFPSQNRGVGPLLPSRASSPAEASVPSLTGGTVSGGNMISYPFEVSPLAAPRNVDFSNRVGNCQMNSKSGVNAAAGVNAYGKPSWQWQELSAQNRWAMSSPAPSDLNGGFLAFGSGTPPNPSVHIGSPPNVDLVLQL